MAKQYKLSRKKSNREAMVQNLVSSLIVHGKIVTTEKRAKAAKPVAEKLLSRVKEPTLANRRYINARLNSTASKVLFDELRLKLADKSSGFIQLQKVVARKGDAADRAALIISLKKEEPKTPVKKKTSK